MPSEHGVGGSATTTMRARSWRASSRRAGYPAALNAVHRPAARAMEVGHDGVVSGLTVRPAHEAVSR